MASKAAPDIGSFLDTQDQQEEQPKRRRKGAKDIVCLTLRMNQRQWRQIHDFSLNEGLSINQLCLDGISCLLKQKGLPPLGA
jgi:hypothetical protein